MPKFIITHADGSPVDPDARYFVLRCDGDSPKRAAARAAVFEFATIVRTYDPEAAQAASSLALKEAHAAAIQLKPGARGLADS